MKKIIIVMVLFSTIHIHGMDNKKAETLRDRRTCHYPSYPQPKKKTLSAQELEILAAQKKADSQKLKKEMCVCFGCYLCISSAAIVSYYACTYALDKSVKAATNYFFNTTNS